MQVTDSSNMHFVQVMNAEVTHSPAFPEETHKPIKPDLDTPYQPTEPTEPDVQPEIIGEK